MILCAWLQHFALRVLAHGRVSLDQPVALASTLATHPVVIDCTAAARADGVAAGMLLSRALGCCASLQVIADDAGRVAVAGERFLARLESTGAAVHPEEYGRACFRVDALAPLYGGLDGVIAATRQVFRSPDLRIGVGSSRFVSWVAARHAQPGGHVVIGADETRRVLAELPLSLLPVDGRMQELFSALGLRTLGDLGSIDVTHIADRFGVDGIRFHELARGVDERLLVPRVPVAPVERSLQFPEPVGNVEVLRRALELLVGQAVQHPRCLQHAPRSVVVVAALVPSGASGAEPGALHSVRKVLRTPTVDPDRIVLAAGVALESVPAPVERLSVRLEQFELREGGQQALFGQRGSSALTGGDSAAALAGVSDARVHAGLRHVQAALGDDAILQVLELQPDARVPERHSVLVPRHVAGGDEP